MFQLINLIIINQLPKKQKIINSNKNNQKVAMMKSQNSLQQKTLKHDINFLLAVFNDLDSDSQGFITINQLDRFFTKIAIHRGEYQNLGMYNIMEHFQFDDVLSMIGLIEMPEQPSIYVLSFVKVLAQYRNKCIQKSQDDQKGLAEAKEIGDRIKRITKNQLERQKQRLLREHDKIYQEMNKTQNNQFNSFEQQWKKYLTQFRSQTEEKIYKTKNQKLKQLSFQSQKLVKTARRHSLVTSPKLRELMQKKKWLIKQGKYSEVMKINYLIDSQKKKIEDHKQQSLEYTLRKRMQSMKKKNQNALDYIQANMSMNMTKLLSKKKQGQNLMQLRMRNLREQAQKKLNDHLRGELGRLKVMLARASR